MAGFSAYSRRLDWQQFRDIADAWALTCGGHGARCGPGRGRALSRTRCDIADCHHSTTHKTLRGPRGGLILARANPEIEKKLNSALFPGIQGGPLMHVIAGKAVCFKEAMQPEFQTTRSSVIATPRAMAEDLLERGYDVVSGGTDNHLFLLDLIAKDITGKAADAALGRANITVNKNAVPNDPRSPFVTSGLRIGSPAVTRRGFKEAECATLTGWMCDILDDIENDNMIGSVKLQVQDLCARFPVYRAA